VIQIEGDAPVRQLLSRRLRFYELGPHLQEDIGHFDLFSIGRALHWLDESTLGPLFEPLVAPGGVVAV
jgi:hypothetical protein